MNNCWRPWSKNFKHRLLKDLIIDLREHFLKGKYSQIASIYRRWLKTLILRYFKQILNIVNRHPNKLLILPNLLIGKFKHILITNSNLNMYLNIIIAFYYLCEKWNQTDKILGDLLLILWGEKVLLGAKLKTTGDQHVCYAQDD